MSTPLPATPSEAAGDASDALQRAFKDERMTLVREKLWAGVVEPDTHIRAIRFELIRLEEENAAFRTFIDYCASQPGCPFGASARALQQKWAKVENRT